MAGIDLSEETMRDLAALARAENVSVQDEAERLLRFAIDRRRLRLEQVRLLREVAEMTPPGVPQTDSVVLLREDRDR